MFKHRIQQYFIAGLLVWLPLVITAWLLLWLLGMLDGIFATMLKALITVVPGLETPVKKIGSIPGIGVLSLGALILLTGVLAANIVGQWWLRHWDAVLARIPVVRSIYTSVKQVSDTLFSGSGKAFSKALMVQYPRAGAWTIGFLTGAPGGEAARHLAALSADGGAGDYISIYVPTTPNPTSGFFLMVPRADVIMLDMSVDEALKYIISMGVVVPPEHVAAVQGPRERGKKALPAAPAAQDASALPQ